MTSANRPQTRLATRLAFLVAGFGLAGWAPLVPFARDRLGVNEGELGLLLLCLGVGSVSAMMFTGMLSARYGARRVIGAGGLVMALAFPGLAIASTAWTLGAVLLIFGAALGSLDVAMNIHAIEVERDSDRPLMSGFHGLFSVGALAGAAAMTALLSSGLTPPAAAVICTALMATATLVAWPLLLGGGGAEHGGGLIAPKGALLVIAVLAAITFLVEGAVLDWSAVLITDADLVPVAQGGLGYVLFAGAMVVGRLTGDRLTARIGDRATLVGGGLLALTGFAALLAIPVPVVALGGFLLMGLGLANVVPVLFRIVGAQTLVPVAAAIATVTTVGYAGVLLGPAGVGFVAHAIGLKAAFWVLAALTALVPLCAPLVTRRLRP